MTSTDKGLIALLSNGGFKHDFRDIVDGANLGCLFCNLLRRMFYWKSKPGNSAFMTCQLGISEKLGANTTLLCLPFQNYSKEEESQIFRANYSLLRRVDFESHIYIDYSTDENKEAFRAGVLDLYAPEGNSSEEFIFSLHICTLA